MSNVSIKRDTTTFGSIDGEIVLNPLDTIIVNPYNGTINVFGEVNNPGTLEWFENRSIKDYINLSGGLTALGDKKQIVYISPYGNAFKVKRRSNLKILPGGKIMVNQKSENDSNNYSNILQQISALLSSILTIAVIANSAN